MIDFRYHVVSIVAVFLALALGILVGTTVLDRAVIGGLEAQIRRLGGGLEEARADISQLREQRNEAQQLIDELSSWTVAGRLQERSILLVSGPSEEPWFSEVQQAFAEAGAEEVGGIILTERWQLDPEARQELLGILQEVTPAFEPEGDLVASALELLGRRLLEPTGRALIEELRAAGFVAIEGAEPGPGWPVPGFLIAAFSADQPPRSAPDALAAFTRGTAEITPTVVLAGDPEGQTAVSVLRDVGGTPVGLSTFDSGAGDTAGVGAVLALVAAIHNEGGHFGREPGLTFLPAPVEPTPPPAPLVPEE